MAVVNFSILLIEIQFTYHKSTFPLEVVDIIQCY